MTWDALLRGCNEELIRLGDVLLDKVSTRNFPNPFNPCFRYKTGLKSIDYGESKVTVYSFHCLFHLIRIIFTYLA